MDIPPEKSSRDDLGMTLNFDIAVDLPANFNISDFDVGMNNGLLPDDEAILTNNGPVKGSVDSNGICELQFACTFRSVVQEAAHHVFRFTRTSHTPFLLEPRFHETFVESVHFIRREEMQLNTAFPAALLNCDLRAKRLLQGMNRSFHVRIDDIRF